ncbi:hypothetical protein N9937_01685 [bacterium]|nr:hypothetical protein [bacterium]
MKTGNRKTQVPAIAEPTQSNLLQIVKSIKEITEVAEMRRGDPLDAKVTFRDLVDGGLAGVGAGFGSGTRGFGGGGTPANPTVPGPNSPFLIPPDYNAGVLPGRPANVTTHAVWDGIQVHWDWPVVGEGTYWHRAIIHMSATPNFEDGSEIGSSTMSHFLHQNVGLSTGPRYYWVCWEGRYNPETERADRTDFNPYAWEAGVEGNTAQDPSYVIDILEGEVNEAMLGSSLNRRIDLVDYNPDDPKNPFTTSVQERILAFGGDTEGIYAAIAQVAKASVHTDDAGNTIASGEYSVRIDNNGRVVGFGLNSLSTIDGSTGETVDTSAFVLRADYFAIGGPLTQWSPDDGGDPTSTASNTYPFIVSIKNNVATVGIRGDLLVDGTVTANAIQAGSIGVGHLDAGEIYSDFLQSTRIITGTFETSVAPDFRLEINGSDTSKGNFPLWYGNGHTTGGSGSVFYADKFGNLKLAGDMYVTGTGRFFAGNTSSGEFRLELGGPNDEFLLWAGTGTKSKSNVDGTRFWIDNDGAALFRGTLEALFVSGEISRQTPIKKSNRVAGKLSNATETHGTVNGIASGDWTTVGEWELPPSQFQPHLPTMTVTMGTSGAGVRTCAFRVMYKVGGGGWSEMTRGIIDQYNFPANTTVQCNPGTEGSDGKTALTVYFRLQFCGTKVAEPTDGAKIPYCDYVNGYLLGLR